MRCYTSAALARGWRVSRLRGGAVNRKQRYTPSRVRGREAALLWTRTLRRKMLVGLTLVLVMLIALSLSGISGWRSYRQMVTELDFSLNQSPRKTDLAAAVGLLSEPLLGPGRAGFSSVQDGDTNSTGKTPVTLEQEFRQRLDEAHAQLQGFRDRLDTLPPSPAVRARRPVTEALLADIERRLDRLEAVHSAWRAGRLLPTDVEHTLTEIAHLQVLAQKLPDYQEGLSSTLKRTREISESRFWWIAGTSIVVVVLFLGLVRYGYVGVFAPLRTLHQGALRVAQGDFDYRVRLRTKDEMAELADAFNQMTQRFQEIADDLDQKVRERSRQLVRSARLAGVGFLAAGVAHEINNPLQAILAAAESLEGRCTELLRNADPQQADVIRKYLRMIQQESVRCRGITAKLLDFARGQDSERTRHDLRVLISEVLSLAGHLSRFRDRHIVFPPGPPCWLEVNGSEIKQVMLNLTANALDAMDPGGTLLIEVTEQTDQVSVTFSDDGCGMTPDVLENLFEPFFTHSKTGKGTGLGMSISHRIITDHGGTIEAESRGPGQGSTFRVHLPRRGRLTHAA